MSAPVQQRLAADADVVRTWIQTLFGHATDGHLGVSAAFNGQLTNRFYPVGPEGIEAAVRQIMTWDPRFPQGIYLQSTLLGEQPPPGKRGGEAAVKTVTHFWSDGDYGTEGHKPGLDDLPHPPDGETILQIRKNSPLPEPTGYGWSGGGGNGVWMLAEPYTITSEEDRARIKALSVGWQKIAGAAAYRAGFTWDIEVGNLDRLMRSIGTVWRKVDCVERPTVIGKASGAVYELADIEKIVAEHLPDAEETLARAAKEKQERRAKRLGTVVPPPRPPRGALPATRSGSGPLDVIADTMTFADVLLPHGWTFQGHHSDGREAWLRPTADGDRPSSSYSLLCNDHVAINWSDRADLPVGPQAPGYKLTVGTVFAHLDYNGNVSEAARDIMRAAGGHQAGPAGRLPGAVLAEVKRRCLVPRDEEAEFRALIADDDGGPDWSDIPTQASAATAAPEGSEAEAGPGRGVIFTPASKIKLRRVRWLWDTTPEGSPPTSHGRIPMYSLVIAAGFPGLGKSQYGVWMTARITTGTLPGELFGKPRAVVYAAAEDSWSMTIAPRLIAAGADMDLVFRVDVQDTETMHARLTLPVDTSLLGKEAEAHSVALLVMDPLLSFIDKGINDYKAADVRQALEPLVAAADRYHFTILGLAHFTKSGAADPVSRVAGSGAFGQLIRALIAFAKEEGDDGGTKFVMSLEKNNLGRLGLPSHNYVIAPVTVPTDEGPTYVSKFVLGPETSTSVGDLMRDEVNGNSMDKSERGEAAEWLEDYLTDRQRGGEALPKDAQAAARAAGISPNALKEAKKKLKIRSVKGVGHNAPWIWQLPDFIPIADDPSQSE